MFTPTLRCECAQPGLIDTMRKWSIPLHVMVLSVMELQLGVFEFLPTTHAETNSNKCVYDLHTLCSISHVYLLGQTAVHVHTHLMNHSYFDHGKNPITQWGTDQLLNGEPQPSSALIFGWEIVEFCNNDQPKINFSTTIQPKINQVWSWNINVEIWLKFGWL